MGSNSVKIPKYRDYDRKWVPKLALQPLQRSGLQRVLAGKAEAFSTARCEQSLCLTGE